MNLLLRPIDAGDKDLLSRFHGRLSADTRYRRFHSAKGALSSKELVYFTEIDQHDHIAVVAVRADGEFAAIARIVTDRDDTAEVAVVVADDARGRGLGTEVVDAAMRVYHRERPGHDVYAHVQTDNRKAMDLFVLRLGGEVARYDEGVAIIRMPDGS